MTMRLVLGVLILLLLTVVNIPGGWAAFKTGSEDRLSWGYKRSVPAEAYRSDVQSLYNLLQRSFLSRRYNQHFPDQVKNEGGYFGDDTAYMSDDEYV